jgi:hypothetical protein
MTPTGVFDEGAADGHDDSADRAHRRYGRAINAPRQTERRPEPITTAAAR